MNVKTSLILAAMALVAFSDPGTLSAAPPEPAEPPESVASRVTHGTNGETVVTLDAATRERMGLTLQALTATRLAPEVKGYGRVIDPAPLVLSLTEAAAAEATGEVSRKEAERLRGLRALENASDRAVEAAEAAAKKDQLAAHAVRARLLLAYGRSLVGSKELSDIAPGLIEGRLALVRVDIPAGERLPGKPKTARFVPLTPGAEVASDDYLGPATSVDPQFQGQGFMFLVKDPAPAPGTALVGFILTDGAPVAGLLVPADAVVRHLGRNWVWAQSGESAFVRKPVVLGRKTGDAYFVSEGFAAGEKVVVVGAQQLLSEELKGLAAEE